METGDLVRWVTAIFGALSASMWALAWWLVRPGRLPVTIPYEALRSLAQFFILVAAATVLAISQRQGEPIHWVSAAVITLPAILLMLHAAYAVLARARTRRRK